MDKLNWLSRHRVRLALRGGQLTCGCIVGVYELYSGDVLSVIDVRGPGCGLPGHEPHSVLPADADSIDDDPAPGGKETMARHA